MRASAKLLTVGLSHGNRWIGISSFSDIAKTVRIP
jgi:hypothetical protein